MPGKKAHSKQLNETREYVSRRLGLHLPISRQAGCRRSMRGANASLTEQTVGALEACLDEAHAVAGESLDLPPSRLSRRAFIQMTGMGAAGIAFARAAWGAPAGVSINRELDSGTESESAVALVRDGSVEGAVRRAISLAGGLDSIKPNDWVIIKPNATFYRPSDLPRETPITTNPDVLAAVIRVVKERNKRAGRIIVSDRAGFSFPTFLVMLLQGQFIAARREGALVLPWEWSRYTRVDPSAAVYLPTSFHVPRAVLANVHFINVPVLKNHETPAFDETVEFTCCLKAFVGACEPNDRLSPELALHTEHFSEKVAELNLCRPSVTMNIVDATGIMLTGGPGDSGPGTLAFPGLILASRDRVACDSVAVAVLKHYAAIHGVTKPYTMKSVWEQGQIAHAGALGLGISNPSRIAVYPSGVAESDSILSYWRH